MSKFVKELRDAEQNFSTVEIDDFIKKTINVSEDLLSLILELNDKKNELKSGAIGALDFDTDEVSEKLNDVDKLDKKSIKQIQKDMLSSTVKNALSQFKNNNNPKHLENALKDLEAEYFFKIDGIDEDEVLNAYCKAIGKEPSEPLKKIALLALKTNEVDTENGTFNFFQYYLNEIIKCINGQFGFQFGQDENF